MSQANPHKLYIAAFDAYYYSPSEETFAKYCKAREFLLYISLTKKA